MRRAATAPVAIQSAVEKERADGRAHDRLPRLAIILTHPIQYLAPVFRALALSKRVHPRVFFTWSQTQTGSVRDRGFGAEIRWDIPLLDGYEYEFVPNVAARPGADSFRGIQNPGLPQAIRAWEADAVLIYGWNLHSHLRALRHFKGRMPVFFRGDSTLLDAQSLVRRFARRLFLTWVYCHVDVAIAVGSNSSDYFARHGVPVGRIAVAPHSVDVQRFAHAADEQEGRAAAWRAELGIGSDELAFLYAGKFYSKKAPDLLLDAFLESGARAHLILCGNGVLESTLRERAAQHRQVHFLPFQNQRAMPIVYRLGDVCVLPSRSETWGLALNEAMACARPVIASSKAGAARDVVSPDMNGWVFEAGDRSQLAKLLHSVAHMDRLRLRSMGAESLRMSHSWSTEEAARRIADIVTAHLASPSGRAAVC